MVSVLLYGLQRSGSNFIESTVSQNFRVDWKNVVQPRNNPGHKHYRLYTKEIFPTQEYHTEHPPATLQALERKLAPPLPAYYLIVSKSPYSWLLSYKKWARRCNWPEPNHHYIEEWNSFYGTWAEWAESSERIVFTRYIDFLNHPEEELGRLSRKMGLTRTWRAHLSTVIPGTVDQSPNFDEERRRYYQDRKYLDQYGPDEWKALCTNLDEDVTRELGYEIEVR
jgi:hypothetical protein